ncbi:hypothetical protein LCGC14_2378220 [marine sediment metagenome]|uniref:Uncharacterized protein n=1 Tax=marine sediment metagenome TaxID=412755 RepID=A0A0F9EWE5_9ZZZZ
MVKPEREELLQAYITAYEGQFRDMSIPGCDRCTDFTDSYDDDIRRWTREAPKGPFPYLCIDCARHYGLAW